MPIRQANINDYDEIVSMYKHFMEEVYPTRTLGPSIAFHKVVTSWLERGVDVFVYEDDGIIKAFSMDYVDTQGGMLSPVYLAEICYVKPEYRNSRCAAKLMRATINRAKENKLKVWSKSSVHNGVDKIHEKLGGKPMFMEMEKN